MRRLALAIAIACVLSGVVRAGEIHTTGAVASPTPSTVAVTGEIHSSDATVPGESHPTGATAPGEMPSTGAKEPQPSGTLLTVILTIISIGF